MSETQLAVRGLQEVHSMEQLVVSTNANLGLGPSLKAGILNAKGSTSVATGVTSDDESDFVSTTLDYSFITHVVDLKQDAQCLGSEGNMNEGFLARFKSLRDIDADRVSHSSSWASYTNFLKDQGSHVMMRQKFGSRFQQWESSTSTDSNITSMLKAKACAEVEGLTGQGWSVQSCAAYDADKRQHALAVSSVSYRVVRGGTSATRLGAVTNLTMETLSALIQAADESNEAVDYTFKPIWEVLMEHYSVHCSQSGPDSEDCGHLQRAYNLQAAYEGWLSYGCPEMKTTTGVVYQRMAIVDPEAEIKTYQCTMAKTGCYDDGDCHHVLGYVPCYCYGPSCFEAEEKVPGTSQKRTTVRGGTSEMGVYREGVNRACRFVLPMSCECNKNWSGGLMERSLWTQGSPMQLVLKDELLLV